MYRIINNKYHIPVIAGSKGIIFLINCQNILKRHKGRKNEIGFVNFAFP